ncbi:DNA polymerase I [Planctomicrobium piriforme]|uniref:DNA polymerase I n=1 Tax=Planctomicrobium piriforme TaxID=1576369 RepID=A0A1I3IYM5_9PLAN|nr:DNA polymerase I [Planctomicrobium piriforme]SFI53087.1 DNA polymerase I [Planctomicrobium piriforme]
MADTLYIVDTFSLVFQVYHAIRQPMTGTRGQPTNAVFGFVGDLQHLLRDKQPTHLAFAMESAEPGERLAIYEEYKANRSAMPDDLRPQIPMIMDVLAGYRVPVISHSGWEADDVIATLAVQAAERGFEVRIVSNDKDLRQLIAPRVKIYHIRKKQFMDEQHLLEEWGIRPDQVIDFQSLVGDSVDNVPGVPGVGPKTARTLLERFGTLDEVLAHADEAPGKKLVENLKTFADQARMCRELVRLRTDLPLQMDWSQLSVESPDTKRLYDLFTDYGFRRYAQDMQSSTLPPPARSKQQQSLFGADDDDDSARPPTVEKEASPIAGPHDVPRAWGIIDTPREFEALLTKLQAEQTICVDLETTSTDPLQADIVGWAIAWKTGEAFYLPVAGPPGSQLLSPDVVVNGMKPILEDAARTIINQNIKYDWLVLRRVGVEIANPGLDPMIGDYLLDAGARSHGQDELARRYLFRQMIPISDLIGKGKQQKKMSDIEVPRVAEYASEDADLALQLAELIEAKLKEENLWELYWNLERQLIPVLVEMEWNGVRIDVSELQQQSLSVNARLIELIALIHAAAGQTFNIDSPKQLAKILFDVLKLPVQKRTKTGPSTDQEVLEKLAPLHPLPQLLTEHRMLSKLKGTYLDALPLLVNPHTGNLHTSFSQVTAATGRLSSSDPNLQNIPIRTPEGSRIRKAFVPSRPGWKLVCLDYSQIELRMLAHFCQDAALQESFRKGEDIHTAVAAQVYGIPQTEVTSAQRRVAKAVNFGVIYGQTAFGLAATLGISKDEAAQFIDDYFVKYATVQKFIDSTLTECRRTGYAKTIMGRRREIVGIRPRVFGNLNLPERTAVNAVIQGSAADLIKQAMINVFHRLRREEHPARMLLQIHDELVFEAPNDAVPSLIALAKEEMSTALELNVPIVVDSKVGDNWLDAAPLA